jgi:predicted RNA binding protein YcfA (HicA-like mRNA interferase family)
MTYRELTRKLVALGCEFRRQSKGSHEIWTNTRNNRSAVIPRHTGDLPAGTVAAILRQLDVSPEDLRKA